MIGLLLREALDILCVHLNVYLVAYMKSLYQNILISYSSIYAHVTSTCYFLYCGGHFSVAP